MWGLWTELWTSRRASSKQLLTAAPTLTPAPTLMTHLAFALSFQEIFSIQFYYSHFNTGILFPIHSKSSFRSLFLLNGDNILMQQESKPFREIPFYTREANVIGWEETDYLQVILRVACLGWFPRFLEKSTTLTRSSRNPAAPLSFLSALGWHR